MTLDLYKTDFQFETVSGFETVSLTVRYMNIRWVLL